MWCLSVFFLFSFLLPDSDNPPASNFIIQDGSELYIDGFTNVRDFSCLCLCYEKDQSHPFQVERNGSHRTIYFEGTILQLEADNLDCGHKGINKDLNQTLKTDRYPYIRIELLKARHSGGGIWKPSDQAIPVEAVVALTIAGVTRQVEMEVGAQTLGANRYHFKAAHDLMLSDFQLEPPRPLFGLVKVEDRIRIYFDLLVEISNPVGAG